VRKREDDGGWWRRRVWIKSGFKYEGIGGGEGVEGSCIVELPIEES
jgi:hypothetical protein